MYYLLFFKALDEKILVAILQSWLQQNHMKNTNSKSPPKNDLSQKNHSS